MARDTDDLSYPSFASALKRPPQQPLIEQVADAIREQVLVMEPGDSFKLTRNEDGDPSGLVTLEIDGPV